MTCKYQSPGKDRCPLLYSAKRPFFSFMAVPTSPPSPSDFCASPPLPAKAQSPLSQFTSVLCNLGLPPQFQLSPRLSMTHHSHPPLGRQQKGSEDWIYILLLFNPNSDLQPVTGMRSQKRDNAVCFTELLQESNEMSRKPPATLTFPSPLQPVSSLSSHLATPST